MKGGEGLVHKKGRRSRVGGLSWGGEAPMGPVEGGKTRSPSEKGSRACPGHWYYDGGEEL